MARSKSSRQWLRQHFNDHFVQRAWSEGRRSRASFKLEEIQAKDCLISRGDIVVDLGAAPGGWTELVADWSSPDGATFAIDILPMDSIANVDMILGDFTDEAVVNKLFNRLEGREVNVVLSDMVPNMSGNKSVDQPKSMFLCELALDFARRALCIGGKFFIKVMQGQGFDEYYQAMKSEFHSVKTRKPDASRLRSREIYLLAQGFKGY